MEMQDSGQDSPRPDGQESTKRQTFLCSMYKLNGVHEPFDPTYDLVTSYIRFLTPCVLACLRILQGLWALAVMILEFWWSVKDGQGNSFLTYFTHLSYIGQSTYFIVAGSQGLVFAHRLRCMARIPHIQSADFGGVEEIPKFSPPSRKNAYNHAYYPLQIRARPLQALFVVLMATVRTYPLHVTVVFWVFLRTPDAFTDHHLAFSNTTTHILNAFSAFSEIFLTNTPVLPWGLLFTCAWVFFLYLGLVYLSHFAIGNNYYPYPFLDPTPPNTLLRTLSSIGANAALYVVLFTLARYLVAIRIWVVNKGSSESKAARSCDVEKKGDTKSEQEMAEAGASTSPTLFSAVDG